MADIIFPARRYLVHGVFSVALPRERREWENMAPRQVMLALRVRALCSSELSGVAVRLSAAKLLRRQLGVSSGIRSNMSGASEYQVTLGQDLLDGAN